MQHELLPLSCFSLFVTSTEAPKKLFNYKRSAILITVSSKNKITYFSSTERVVACQKFTYSPY